MGVKSAAIVGAGVAGITTAYFLAKEGYKVKVYDPNGIASQCSYANGGPHLFFGVINTALPKQLGGNPEAAKKGFEDGMAVTSGNYLMGKALYGYYYFRAVDDRAGYVKTLQEVLDTPASVMPEQRLANELAKVRAKRWLAEADDYFE